ncbi:MAG: glycosyltransferase family 39 protein [Methyloprofundus sp.]|nr:glycosyltransferase family 39 protein [Methyloprofundus sp.]MDT8425790.1 glycosyltransferase family 39 protein [Methyloprofundus sp.]
MSINTAYWFNFNRFKSGNDHQFNLIWLFVFAVTLIFMGIGLREPWPADEPRFAQIAKEMVETGQWFFPMRGGELYPDKPPVFMWSIAFFYWLFGSMKIAFLLPSAICSIITTFLVYDLGRRFWSPQVGWRAASLLLLTIQFTLQAKTAQIDAMLCCWITIGCYGLLRHLLSDNGHWPWYFIACFFMGIGVITKGVGFLPILMLIPYVLLRKLQAKDQEIQGHWLLWGAGIVALLTAIMLWAIPMLLIVEASNNPLFEQYRDNILFKQTITRYANPWHHFKPFWYYFVAVIPLFWLPISLMLPALFPYWKKAIYAADRRIILPLGWVVLVLIFFSISPAKRGVYVLPALPMLALITAPYLEQVLSKKWLNWLIWGISALIGVVFVTVGSAGVFDLSALVKLETKFQVQPWGLILTVGIAASFAALFSFKKAKYMSWLIFIPMLWILYSTWGYRLRDPLKTPKSVLAKVAQKIPEDAELGIVGLREQFLLFSPFKTTHFGYHTPENFQSMKAWQWQLEGKKRYILSYKKADLPCFNINSAIEVGRAHGRDWLILTEESRLPSCNKPPEDVYAFNYDKV